MRPLAGHAAAAGGLRADLATLDVDLAAAARDALRAPAHPYGAALVAAHRRRHAPFQEWGEDLPRLFWRGRWANPKVLGHYVQELATHRILAERPLPPAAAELAALLPKLLLEACAEG